MLIVPLESFSPSYRGKIGTWCRSCFAAYQRARSRGESVDEFAPKGMHEARQCDYCRASYIPKQLKLNAAYCSRECKRASRNAALQDTRNAAKPSRECPHCGTAIGRDRRSDAIFCSAECNSRAHALQRKLRARTGPGEQARISAGRDLFA